MEDQFFQVLSIIISGLFGISSVVVSVIITSFQRKAEMEKLRVELQQQYAKSLFDKRVTVYQELYSLLSGYGKRIQYGQQTKESLREFGEQVDLWNSHNALFFTQPTRRISYKFRYFLRVLLSNHKDTDITDVDWDAIHRIMLTFEDALRAEIGIFDTPSPSELQALDKVIAFVDAKIEMSKDAPFAKMNPDRFEEAANLNKSTKK